VNHMLVIDIGSSQITAAVAEITDARRIVVRGLGRARSGGLKQGVVIQIDSVVEALVRAVAEANQMAGTKLSDPWSLSVDPICLDKIFQARSC